MLAVRRRGRVGGPCCFSAANASVFAHAFSSETEDCWRQLCTAFVTPPFVQQPPTTPNGTLTLALVEDCTVSSNPDDALWDLRAELQGIVAHCGGTECHWQPHGRYAPTAKVLYCECTLHCKPWGLQGNSGGCSRVVGGARSCSCGGGSRLWIVVWDVEMWDRGT